MTAYTEVPGISAWAQAAAGDPTALPVAVPGIDFNRNRAYVGNNTTPVELKLAPNVTVNLVADNDLVVQLPANPLANQCYGIKFTGDLPDTLECIITANGIAFDVTTADGQYETECQWDVPVRNSEAWFMCVSVNNQLLWRHI